jgi:hypothetical protein
MGAPWLSKGLTVPSLIPPDSYVPALTPPEHYRSASYLVALAGDPGPDGFGQFGRDCALLAQVHATLAAAGAAIMPPVLRMMWGDSGQLTEWAHLIEPDETRRDHG